MTKNERFLNMLKIMNFEVTDDIASGVVVGYKLLEDNKTWRVTLEFDSLLTVERVNSLTSGIKQYLVDNPSFMEEVEKKVREIDSEQIYVTQVAESEKRQHFEAKLQETAKKTFKGAR